MSTGVFFDYMKLDSMAEAKAALKDGRIDILSYCGETSKSMKAEGLAVTKVYAQMPQVIIMRSNGKSDAITALAVEESSASGRRCKTSQVKICGFWFFPHSLRVCMR